MSEILTLEKTIDLGFQLQKDSLDFLKYVENQTKGGVHLISHSIFDSSNREKLAMITKHMEAYLEELICFCGGCGTYGVECFDLYDAYKFLFDMYDEHNRHMTVIGRSLGGGQIMITEVDGNDMSITGDEFTLVVFHEDRPGAISLVSQALSESDINIATMRVFRKGKHKDAVMVITTDTVVNPITVQFMREFPGIQDVMTFEAL